MIEITGLTRLLAILADPVHHVQTPQRINEFMRQNDRDGIMVPLHVSPERLSVVVDALRELHNLDGFVITVPHKQAMTALCDELTPRAQRIGAVNVVRRRPDGTLLGDMLDGEGFVGGLRSAGIEPAARRVYLAGAGGASSAIAFALADAGVRHLSIANRTASRAEQLIARIAPHYPEIGFSVGTRDASGHDLVINGTSLGMRLDDELPLDVSTLDASQTVAEIIMQPVETPLLRAARGRGCRIHFGAPMLKSQVALMAAFMGEPDRRRSGSAKL